MKELLYKLVLLAESLLESMLGSVDSKNGQISSGSNVMVQSSTRRLACLEEAKSLSRTLLYYLEHPERERPKSFDKDYCRCLILYAEGGLFD